MRAVAAAAAILLVLLIPATANATGFEEAGADLRAQGGGTAAATVATTGALRLRGEALANLDLDRGLTPSGAPFFPVPTSDPSGQVLTHGDLRLRTDLAFYAPGRGVAVKLRLDLLDDVGLGAHPEGAPQATSSQAGGSIVVKRAWGEALTPIGVLAAGRIGSRWGLGILANGGDCADCDGGDSADRVAFITPLAGHIWAAAYDMSATGPFTPRADGRRSLDLDPSDDVRSVTFAVLRWRDDDARDRRRRAGKSTVDYGAYASHRWQENDVPGWTLPVAGSPIGGGASAPGGGPSMARGYRATALDGWLRLTLPAPSLRIEAEAAVILGSIDQPSLIPGALLPRPLRSTQIGAALESELGAPDSALAGGVDVGFASGDPAPGFGAFPKTGAAATMPGDLDGPQAAPPDDYRVDNFRFHPDYHIDRILFRELIGTVTDALYVRPHVRWRIAPFGAGALTASVAWIYSRAIEASSTPSGAPGLGVEVDPTLAYQSRDGFTLSLEGAILVPLAGLDNPATGQSAESAQLIRARLVYGW